MRLKIYIKDGFLCFEPYQNAPEEAQNIFEQLLQVEGIYQEDNVCKWPLGNFLRQKYSQPPCFKREADLVVSVSLRNGNLELYPQDCHTSKLINFIRDNLSSDYLKKKLQKSGWWNSFLSIITFEDTNLYDDDDDESTFPSLSIDVSGVLRKAS